MKPTAKNSSNPSDDIPDSLVEILCVRARYEEGIIAKIKVALAAGDKDLVFRLADQMIYEGPGTIPRTPQPKVTKRMGKTGRGGPDKK
jgi:hypothetical protein